MHSTPVTGSTDVPVARRHHSSGMNPIVKIALAAIALVSGLVVMTAFPPAVMLFGGLLVTGLFLSCLGNSRSTFHYPPPSSTGSTIHVPTVPVYTSPPRGDRWRVDREVVDLTYVPPARGGRSSYRPGPLSSAYTRTASSPSSARVFGGGNFSSSRMPSVGHSFGASSSRSGPPPGTGGSYPPPGKSGGALGSEYTRVNQ